MNKKITMGHGHNWLAGKKTLQSVMNTHVRPSPEIDSSTQLLCLVLIHSRHTVFSAVAQFSKDQAINQKGHVDGGGGTIEGFLFLRCKNIQVTEITVIQTQKGFTTKMQKTSFNPDVPGLLQKTKSICEISGEKY